MSIGFSFIGDKKDFYTNNNLSDWETIDFFYHLMDEADKEGFDLETDDEGGFILRVKNSKDKDNVFRCCANLREVEIFLDGIFCARLIEGKPTTSRMYP